MERKLEAAQESIGDHQQTILKFRDLVAKLQVRVHFSYGYKVKTRGTFNAACCMKPVSHQFIKWQGVFLSALARMLVHHSYPLPPSQLVLSLSSSHSLTVFTSRNKLSFCEMQLSSAKCYDRKNIIFIAIKLLDHNHVTCQRCKIQLQHFKGKCCYV